MKQKWTARVFLRAHVGSHNLEVTTKPVSTGLGDGFTRIKDGWDGEFLNFVTWYLKGGCSHGGHKDTGWRIRSKQLEEFDNNFKRAEQEPERWLSSSNHVLSHMEALNSL